MHLIRLPQKNLRCFTLMLLISLSNALGSSTAKKLAFFHVNTAQIRYPNALKCDLKKEIQALDLVLNENEKCFHRRNNRKKAHNCDKANFATKVSKSSMNC